MVVLPVNIVNRAPYLSDCQLSMYFMYVLGYLSEIAASIVKQSNTYEEKLPTRNSSLLQDLYHAASSIQLSLFNSGIDY